MSKKIDRTGEERVNSFGSKMVIKEYRNKRDIDIYFPEYNWTFEHVDYSNFKRGNVKCPYERRYFNAGYLGEGKYKMHDEVSNPTKCYNAWYGMLTRCYNEKYHEKYPTYIDCEVYKEWLNFQNFGVWYEDNYYEIKGERMALDKDILIKGNKIYSPDTCIFVPQTINSLFIKRNKARGKSVIGTTPVNGKYKAQCQIFNPETGKSKQEYLGTYDTQEKAFEVYKQFKERYIKRVAEHYKDQIPDKLYQAMYKYEVDIND